jgi:hypothetical protein
MFASMSFVSSVASLGTSFDDLSLVSDVLVSDAVVSDGSSAASLVLLSDVPEVTDPARVFSEGSRLADAIVGAQIDL